MSTLRATDIKHELSATNQIGLGSDGSIGGTLGDTLAAKLTGETGSTEPTGKSAGYFWADTNQKVAKVYTGSDWLSLGKVIQVVSATRTGAVTSSSSTYANTGLSASITPTSTTSKVLVLVTHNGCAKNTGDTALDIRLLRNGSTEIGSAVENGNTASTARNYFGSVTLMVMDSPSSTSALTYATQLRSTQNISGVTVDQGSNSTIVLVEVAA